MVFLKPTKPVKIFKKKNPRSDQLRKTEKEGNIYNTLFVSQSTPVFISIRDFVGDLVLFVF